MPANNSETAYQVTHCVSRAATKRANQQSPDLQAISSRPGQSQVTPSVDTNQILVEDRIVTSA